MAGRGSRGRRGAHTGSRCHAGRAGISARSGQHVAADPGNVDRHLANGLTGVEQIENAVGAGDAPDRGGRVHQAAIGRHVRDGDQLDARVDHAFERFDIEFAVWVAGDDVDNGAGAAGDLQEGDVVAGVFRLGGENAVAGSEADGIESHVPGRCGVFDQCDLRAVGVQETRDQIVDRFDLAVRRRGGFVAADLRFKLEMAKLRGQHRCWHQRRTGIVEMQDVLRSRRIEARPRHVDGHWNLRRAFAGSRLGSQCGA